MPGAIVTGGAGFLGSHLCGRLLRDGWRVVCLDNLSTGHRRNLESFIDHPSFSFVEADVTRSGLGSRPDPTGTFDVLFHLACPASPVQYSRIPIETLEVSSLGTRNALEAAHRAGATFVLASTSEVYGDPLVHPQPETYWGNVDPIGPRSMYDEGKRFAEALTTWHGRVHQSDVRIVRIFNTYGPRMDLHDGRVVPTFIRQALEGEPLTVHGDGRQTRSFCYVEDLIEGFTRVASAPESALGDLPVNLGSPAEMTILEIARTIVEHTRSASEIRFVDRPPGDPERRRPDISRARLILRWEPATSLEEGLRRTVAWARGQGS